MLEVVGAYAELALSDNILIRALPELDQYYAFNIENGDHFSLNFTAYWLFKEIGSGSKFGELTGKFADTFGLETEGAYRDISELIEFALENKIITRRHGDEEKTELRETKNKKGNQDAICTKARRGQNEEDSL